MKELSIINTIFIAGIVILLGMHGDWTTEIHEATENRIAALELALAAKVQPKIKFYTIPGYKCDTSIIAGYCSNMYPVTQAEYDKKNSHLFKVTE